MALAALTLLLVQRCSLLLASLPNVDLLWLGLPAAIAALWYPRIKALGWIVIALLVQFEQLLVSADPKQLSPYHQQTLRVTAEVTSLISHGRYADRFTADIIQAPTAPNLKGHRIQLFYNPEAQAVGIKPGSQIKAIIQLRALRGLVNDHAGHSHQTMIFRGITGRGKLISHQVIRAQPSPLTSLSIRHKVQRWLDESLPPRSSQVIQAITIGATATMDRPRRERLQATGTQHLMVISGLHLSLVGWGVFKILRWVGLPITYCFMLAGLAVTGYFWISAQAVSVLRASVMCLLVIIQGLARIRIAFSAIYWLAMILTLVHSPWVSGLPGFWYSFTCVGVLLLIANTQRTGAQTSWIRFLLTFKTQVLLALAMIPLGSILSGFSPMIAPIVNQIAIPLMSIVILPPALASIFVYLMSEAFAGQALEPIAQGLLAVSGLGFQLFWIVLDVFYDLSVSLTLARLPVLYLAVAFGAFLIAITGLRLLPIAAIVAIWLVFFAPKLTRPEHGTLTIHVMDVGQGNSLLLQTAQQNLLYDAGPLSRSGFDAGAAIVIPELRALGIDHLNRLIISHGDADHAGGQGSLERALKIDEVIDPNHVDCQNQRAFNIDGVRFQLLSWQGGTNRNNRSCLLQVQGPGFSLLLSGDIEVDAELALLRRLQGNVDWLLVPHHGSRTSSSPALLNHVMPKSAVIAAGFSNRFQHPHPEILARYQNRHTRLWSTAEHGALTFKADAKGLHWVSSARQKHQRFWSD